MSKITKFIVSIICIIGKYDESFRNNYTLVIWVDFYSMKCSDLNAGSKIDVLHINHDTDYKRKFGLTKNHAKQNKRISYL